MSAFSLTFGDLQRAELPEPARAGACKPGTIFGGRFRVDSLLGQGGMGQVFRATDLHETRTVAIKLLSGELTDARRTRFAREGHLISSLDHRGIVRVFGGGTTEEGRGFLVLEFVPEARGLLDLVDEDPERGLRALVEVARALGYAHQRGIVHRDVKSENVLVDRAGRARICDFGLAYRADLDRLTQTGAMLGTPLAMAPEQLERSSDAPAPTVDVWGLGVMLYQALTGSYPYDASNLLALVRAITEEPLRPPRALAPDVSPRLEAVCLRALERRPADRYPDGDAFAEALAGALRAPVEAPSGAPFALGIALTAALLIGLAVAVLPTSTPSIPPPDPSTTPTTSATTASTGTKLPAWWGELAPDRRPPLPLPEGIDFGDAVGQYENAPDRSVLVWIPPGTFRMGSARGERDEQPVREVKIATGLFLGRTEVTWAQYLAFCQATQRKTPQRTIAMYLRTFTPGDDHPVFNVTWNDAIAYCRWARLRLPSEAEWEYAARGPQSRRYPWGEEAPQGERANLGKFRPQFQGDFRDAQDGFLYTAPTGAFADGASPFGALDLCGNVWEWVQDTYHGSYAGAPRDGSAWTTLGDRPGRVRRGGGWDVHPDYAVSSYRARLEETKGLSYVGFRVAR